MIFEIRLYTIVPGRLNVAFERFEHHLPALFARHGIRNVGRWAATAGPAGPMFVYLLGYETLAERETQWADFYRDPDWFAVRASTQGDEEATERFDLMFASASPAWAPATMDPAARVGGAHDLILAETALGRGQAVNAFLAGTYLPALERNGAVIMMVGDLIAGPALPKVAILAAWPDAGVRQHAWSALGVDEELNAALADQRQRYGRALLGRTDTILMEPTAFALPLLYPATAL